MVEFGSGSSLLDNCRLTGGINSETKNTVTDIYIQYIRSMENRG